MPQEQIAQVECLACKKKLAARVWIQAFGSFSLAKLQGGGPDFLAALIPPPGLMKVEVCFGCGSIKLCGEYTEEEQQQMKAHTEEVKEWAARSEKMTPLFNLFMPKKTE